MATSWLTGGLMAVGANGSATGRASAYPSSEKVSKQVSLAGW